MERMERMAQRFFVSLPQVGTVHRHTAQTRHHKPDGASYIAVNGKTPFLALPGAAFNSNWKNLHIAKVGDFTIQLM
jgi:hypothetical protein